MSHGVEGFRGPGVVPIYRAAIYNRRELATPVSELVSYWGEGKDDVHIFSAQLYEVCVDLVPIFPNLSLPGAGCQLIAYLGFLFCWEQVWHFTTVEEVINIFQEGFLDDLGV
jgi:hypothetical protein